MSNSQLKQSLKDIIPTYQGSFPAQLLSFIDSLYSLSLQKKPALPNKSEIARYHICAYLAAEKYQDAFNLPDPEVNKIPVQPKIVGKLLTDFRENLLNQIGSASSTPRSSPRAAQRVSSKKFTTPTSSPTKSSPTKANIPRSHTPKISSPLKRLRELKHEGSNKKPKASQELNDEESPFNPRKKTAASPASSTPGTPTVYRYDKKHITIPDFISFANNFYIPSTITPKMVETFLEHKHKFSKKSEWLLACGMIHAAYIRINHKLLQRIGTKTQFQNQLFQYQKGGLMKWNMLLWCNIIEDTVKNEQWIIELEQIYIYGTNSLEEEKNAKQLKAKVGDGWDLLERFGNMVNGSVQFDSDSQHTYYTTWTNNVLVEIDK